MSTKTEERFEVPYAVPPGETLEETIKALEMSQAELARRTGLTPKTINQIVKGKAPITPDTALSLEKATRVPARLWNNLESGYQEALSRIAETEALENDLDLLEELPVKELVGRGAIEPTSDKIDLLRRIFVFFGVADRASWENVWQRPAATFKQSERLMAHPGAVASWLRLGELEASQRECASYSREAFRSALDSIREMTRDDVEHYQHRMIDMCANSGVALVFIPEIRGARAWGATRWLTPSKAMIQLSLRYKWEDHFWFSFFHEAAHVLLHGKRETFVDSNDGQSPLEDEANEFAARKLIPRHYESLLSELTTLKEIEDFAEEVAIHPGIVVGRLQREGVIGFNVGNRLRRKLMFADDSALESTEKYPCQESVSGRCHTEGMTDNNQHDDDHSEGNSSRDSGNLNDLSALVAVQRQIAAIDFSAITEVLQPSIENSPAVNEFLTSRNDIARNFAKTIDFSFLAQTHRSFLASGIHKLASPPLERWAKSLTRAVDTSAFHDAAAASTALSGVLRHSQLHTKAFQQSIEEIGRTLESDKFKLPTFDVDRWTELINRWIPTNLHGVQDLDEVATIALKEGVPLTWIPRREIVVEVLEADTREKRLQVLIERRDDILEDCEDVLSPIPHEWAVQCQSAIRALRLGGLDGPAQSHASNILDSIVLTLFGRNGRLIATNRALESFSDEPLQLAAENLTLRPLLSAFTPWWPDSEDPPPDYFARHPTSHAVGHPELFTPESSLIAVMLATSLIVQYTIS